MSSKGIEMTNFLRILGWTVLVGGSCTSSAVFWIAPMNGRLWALMATGVAASVGVGLVLRWLGTRVGRGNP